MKTLIEQWMFCKKNFHLDGWFEPYYLENILQDCSHDFVEG